MTSEKGCRKEKNQNIQVFVRLRPLNQRERDIKSLGVVEVVNGREVVVRQSHQSLHTKRFTFDRAFPPHSKQVEVYQEVVSPLIEEVLAGYNCTVFAYGQTGTGKTHTMVGEATGDESSWQTDPLAGIIPRALSQLFDELRISNTEYTVRVSYLELYNEELFDLLSTSEDNSKLRIYEDVTRKGSNIVNGLEEITVYNKNEVYKIMGQGQERKRVASTLMNSQSSRSHTVFTIVVHMKENSPEGEELVKIGKLNLVDLAGSENISKAGSDNPAKRERARECVNINQSLLTLGRVITALVERHPHIPYRESKLTRILQESLGGRTKTSIIATISPGHKDLEETMSTLEYANRAKNIQNKPEINQKMTKKAILKDYAEEIDRLKRDLHAAREKNGVYLANETFTEMTLKQEEQRKEIQELLLKKRAMEEERDRMESVFKDMTCQLEQNQDKLSKTIGRLCRTENDLANTTNILNSTQLHYEEQKHLVGKQAQTESALSTQARQLLAAADAAATDARRLHDSVDRRRSLESVNLEITRTYRDVSAQHRNNIITKTDNFVATLTQSLTDIQTVLESYTKENSQVQMENKQKIDQLMQQVVETMNKVTILKTNVLNDISATAAQHSAQFRGALSGTVNGVQDILDGCSRCFAACLQRAEQLDLTTKMVEFLQHWQSDATNGVTSLRCAHAAYETSASEAARGELDAARRLRDTRRAVCERLHRDIEHRLAVTIEDRNRTTEYLSNKEEEIESEKQEFVDRFARWAEEERRLLEERIQRHWTVEKAVLDDRMKKKLEDIENQRVMLEKRIEDNVEWLNNKLKDNLQEIEKAEESLKQYTKEIETRILNIKNFTENCETDCKNIALSIDGLNEGTLNIVDQVKVELVHDLRHTHAQVQEQSSALKVQNRLSLSQLAEASDKILENIVQNYHRTMDTVAGEINATTSSTIEGLSSLSSSTANLNTSNQSHQNQQTVTLSSTHRHVEQFYGKLREELAQIADLESRCLNQEYTVYSPSGNTPARKEYSYPRTLAATSPHERILARFRAMRQNSHEDDCVVLESDAELRSDSESSASEDSAVVFVAPSPPTQLNGSTNHNHCPPQPHIVKCTSETDIYLRRRIQEQPGKENSAGNIARSNSFKKPSKLPAPASHKKPLYERNSDH